MVGTGEDLEFNVDFQWKKLFKFYDVKFCEDYDELLERIIAYVKAMVEFCDTKIFVFVGLKDYLTDVELNALYKELLYLKVYVLMIERKETEIKNEFEDVYVLDKDSCFIILHEGIP